MNPYIILAIVIAFAVTNAGSYVFGRGDGKTMNEAVWQKREAQINAESAVKLEAANKLVRDTEQAHANQLNAVDTDYQRKLKGTNEALKIALNAVAAGGKLYAHSTCPPPIGNADSKTATGSGLGNGGAGAELSPTDTDFLLRLGSEADSVVVQLQACQAVVKSDRIERPVLRVR